MGSPTGSREHYLGKTRGCNLGKNRLFRRCPSSCPLARLHTLSARLQDVATRLSRSADVEVNNLRRWHPQESAREPKRGKLAPLASTATTHWQGARQSRPGRRDKRRLNIWCIWTRSTKQLRS